MPALSSKKGPSRKEGGLGRQAVGYARVVAKDGADKDTKDHFPLLRRVEIFGEAAEGSLLMETERSGRG